MPKAKDLIVRVWKNRSNNQKLVTIPKRKKDINEGDFVKIIKVKIIEF